jgi:hypothetical protein
MPPPATPEGRRLENGQPAFGRRGQGAPLRLVRRGCGRGRGPGRGHFLARGRGPEPGFGPRARATRLTRPPVGLRAAPLDSEAGRLRAAGEGSSSREGPGWDLENRSALLSLERAFAGVLRLGAAPSAGRAEIDFGSGAGADSDDASASLFARCDAPSWLLSLEVFLGKSEVEAARLPEPGQMAKGRFAAKWSGFSLTAGRLFGLGKPMSLRGWAITAPALNVRSRRKRGGEHEPRFVPRQL